MQLPSHLLYVMVVYTCAQTGQSVPLGRPSRIQEPLTDVSEIIQIDTPSGTPTERPREAERTRNASQVLLKLLNKLKTDQNQIRKMSQQVDPLPLSLHTLFNEMMDNSDSMDSDHMASKGMDLDSNENKLQKLTKAPLSAIVGRIIMTNNQNSNLRFRRSTGERGSRSLRELLDNDNDDQTASEETEQQQTDDSLDNSILDGTVERYLTNFLSDMLKVFEYDLKNMAKESQRHKSLRSHRRRHDRPGSRPKRSIRKMFHEDPTIREILMKYLKLKGNDRSGKHLLRYG